MKHTRLFDSLAAALVACLFALPVLAQSDKELQKIDPPEGLDIPPAPVLTPEQALKTFEIEEGFEIQLVAAEPLVEHPVCMAWDEYGRLWVCEMKGYMPNLEAEGEQEPVGNIVILEDTNADGQMDKRTVWMDQIVLPRAIAFANNGVLFADSTTLWFVRLNADGSAGAKMPVDPKYSDNGGRPSNVEHQANGLLYGLDNWYYSAKSSRRYKFVDGRIRKDYNTEFRGQWGITQDDDGRLLANRNPVLIEYHTYPPSATVRNPNFKFKGAPILRTDNSVYPIRVTPGTNRAYRPNQDVSHETWKLQRATAASGPVIYRGTQFPEAFYGNVFVPEPSGHLVKRIILGTDDDGKPTAKHAYKDREFLASTDERNRFVNSYTGPDGALYLVDMYRGVIQHKTYVTDYLKRQIKARGLEYPIGMGRIYRVVHKDSPIDHAMPNLAEMDSLALVQLLAHPNAWHRMTAQRLLVQRNDDASVVALEAMATTHNDPQARIHALWTLDGMRGKLKAGILAKAGESTDPRVRTQVLRLAEQYQGKTEALLFVDLMQTYSQQDPNWPLDLQLALSAGTLAGIDTPEAYDVLLSVLQRRGDDVLFRSAAISGLQGKEAVMLAMVPDGPIKKELTSALVKATENGNLTIGSLLALIDQPDFADSKAELLKNLAGQAVDQNRYEVIDQLVDRLTAQDADPADQTAILQGMNQAIMYSNTKIELDGKPQVFDQWQENAPEHLADLVTKLDETFVYEREVLSPEMQRRIELGSLHYATHCSSCHGPDGDGIVKVAPPLVESEWVTMHPRTLIRLILNGVEGDIEVNGKLYTSPEDTPGIMPGMSTAITSDQDLADILTYIRSKEFKNNASPVDAETVADVRQRLAARNGAFAVEELKRIDQIERGEVVTVDSAGRAGSVVKASWLDHNPRNLMITLFGVIAPLVLLLIATVFGGMAKDTA